MIHLLLKIEQLQSKVFQASASHAATDEVRDNYFSLLLFLAYRDFFILDFNQ